MDDTSGFYKLDGDLLHGKIIFGPTYTLIETDNDLYEYPIDGWCWLGNETEARLFFDLPPVEPTP